MAKHSRFPLMIFGLIALAAIPAKADPLTVSFTGSNFATLGVAYIGDLIATGGVPPYTFSIVTGLLPDGLTLNASTGEITGTPTLEGTFTATAKVTDSNPNTTLDSALQSFTIIVSPGHGVPEPSAAGFPLLLGITALVFLSERSLGKYRKGV